MTSSKLTGLTETTTPTYDDVLYIVDSPGGTPASRKVTLQNLTNVYNAKQYGAVGDGVTDDSTAIQAVIDTISAAGGGVVYFPHGSYRCNLTLAEGVYLVGEQASSGFGYYGPGGPTLTQLKANTTGAVVDTPVAETFSCGVAGLNIYGLGEATPGNAIRFRHVHYGVVKNVHISNFADEGILEDSDSGANKYIELLAMNCLLDRSRGAMAGVIDLSGDDDWLSKIESTASLTSLTDANMYCCGVVIRGTNSMLDGVVGEISDLGIVITGGGLSRLSNCRADLNYAHGFYFMTGLNMLSTCLALNNSQETTNTYSGFYLSASTAQGNTFVGCISSNTAGTVQKYGFEDLATYSAVSSRNNYIGCNGLGNGTNLFGTTNYLGSAPILPSHAILPADSDTTPTVHGTSFVILGSYTGNTTITDFDDGIEGQDLWLLGDTNVTIQNNANIVTNTGGDKNLAANKIYHFKNWNGVWYEAE